MSFPPSRSEDTQEKAQRLSRVPSDPRYVHLIAVCGTGMGALASMLAASGREVTGSDQAVYPPMSTQLARSGIRVFEGYSGANLSGRPDLVIVGNAMSRGNPEIEALLESGIPYVSMPEALRLYFLEGRHPLVVVGTHGKTTTTSLAASTLLRAGRDPSLMVGGVVGDFNGGYRLGEGRIFVLEGDEYDTAFFDKDPKFLHYAPQTAILTSVEFDHADIYRDLEHVRSVFRKFVRLIPSEGFMAVCHDDREACLVSREARCRISRYGLEEGADLRGAIEEVTPSETRFKAMREGQPLGTFAIPLPGAHNVRNALGVIAACLDLGLGPDEVREGLSRFGGVARRQEVRGEADGVLVVDDFAHHPTSLAATIEAVRAQYPDRRLWAVFEPRSNTSRRKVHQKEYVNALGKAELAIIAGVDNPGKIPEEERLSPEKVATDLQSLGRDAHYIEHVDEIVTYLCENARRGDVLLVMSNGSFGNIHDKLLAALSAR